jgi:hypothetical protein
LLHRDWAGALRQAAKAASLTNRDYPYLHVLKAFAFAGMNDRLSAKTEAAAFRRLKPDDSSWPPQIRQRLNAIDSFAIGNSSQPDHSGSGHATSP